MTKLHLPSANLKSIPLLLGFVAGTESNQPDVIMEFNNPVVCALVVTREYVDHVPATTQFPGKLTKISAHPSRIFGSELSKWTGMSAQHRDP